MKKSVKKLQLHRDTLRQLELKSGWIAGALETNDVPVCDLNTLEPSGTCYSRAYC